MINGASSMLVDTPKKRIKQCANPSCILTFKDTSKSGRRKWCSMEVCGNRAKVATHYKKRILNEGA
ncbi:CGNR zinc finger domain-containing protein [Litorimonas taeanensis]|uniref:CGNR zinc finger domain-containing protein n=1 Tax=Litorimonas taeanensis TaxID=568099 RepID=UPI000EB38BDF